MYLNNITSIAKRNTLYNVSGYTVQIFFFVLLFLCTLSKISYAQEAASPPKGFAFDIYGIIIILLLAVIVPRCYRFYKKNKAAKPCEENGEISAETATPCEENGEISASRPNNAIVSQIVKLVVIAVILVVLSQFISVFTVPPFGTYPKGATMIVWRTEKMKFIDSTDAVCVRSMGGVNLLCRAIVMGAVIQEHHIITLPYIEPLYLISTGGQRYKEP
jgi:hypothetical protein